MFDVSYLAVFLAAIANMIVGAVWYSPALFCHQWLALRGIDRNDKEKMAALKENAAQIYALTFLGSIIMAYILALVFYWLGVEDGQTGAIVAIFLWLGFTAVPSFTSALFEKRSKKLWSIDEGYWLVSFVVMAVVLVVFQ